MTRLDAIKQLRKGHTISRSFRGGLLTPMYPSRPYHHTFTVSLRKSGRCKVKAYIESSVYPAEKPIVLTTRQVLRYIRQWFPRGEKS
jgi:hypothetical protein